MSKLVVKRERVLSGFLKLVEEPDGIVHLHTMTGKCLKRFRSHELRNMFTFLKGLYRD